MPVAAPGKVERQAKVLETAGDNGQDCFSTDMAEAMNRPGETEHAEGDAVKERNKAEKAEAGKKDGTEDMDGVKEEKDTDNGANAAAGLVTDSAARSVPVEASASIETTEAVMPAAKNNMETGVVDTAGVDDAETEAVETAGAVVTDGPKTDKLNEKLSDNKFIVPEKAAEADKLTDEANGAEKAGKDARADSAGTKPSGHDKGVKGEFVIPPGTEPVKETVHVSEAKALAAAIDLEQADGSTGTGAGGDRGDGKGSSGNTGHKAGEVLGLNPLNRQNAAYETAAAAGRDLSRVEKTEVYEKLSTGVRMSVAKDGGEVKLSLRPDHLGNLSIKLNIDDGMVKARIIVESAAVKDALDADTAGLRDVFTKNNLVLDRYTVEIAHKGFSADAGQAGFSGFAGFDRSPRETFFSNGNINGKTGVTTELTAPADAPRTMARRISGIDLFI